MKLKFPLNFLTILSAFTSIRLMAQNDSAIIIPVSWIDPSTGHNIIWLTPRDGNNISLYFQNITSWSLMFIFPRTASR
jgi:hypothetical protein